MPEASSIAYYVRNEIVYSKKVALNHTQECYKAIDAVRYTAIIFPATIMIKKLKNNNKSWKT